MSRPSTRPEKLAAEALLQELESEARTAKAVNLIGRGSLSTMEAYNHFTVVVKRAGLELSTTRKYLRVPLQEQLRTALANGRQKEKDLLALLQGAENSTDRKRALQALYASGLAVSVLEGRIRYAELSPRE